MRRRLRGIRSLGRANLSRIFTRRWIAWHLLCLVGLGLCIFGFVWQFTKAESAAGSLLNILYATQWPIFAITGAYGWFRTVWLEFHPPPTPAPLLYDEPDPGRIIHEIRPRAITARPHYSEYIQAEDPEMDDYNEHLRELNERVIAEQEA